MNFMTCGSCATICQVNNTGICLGCQRGFVNLPQEDAWVNSEDRQKYLLEQRKREIEEALEKSAETENEHFLKRRRKKP